MATDKEQNILSPAQVAERGQKIYNETLKAKLEPAEKGKFVVIEVESGEYVVAETLIDALQKAREKYPNKVFHTIKIGFEGIFKMGNYAHKGYFLGVDSF